MTSEIDKKKSFKILKRLKKKKSRSEVKEEKKSRLVIFTAAEKFFAYYGSQVVEILPKLKINAIPTAPSHILGFINVRGEIESVIEINSLLNLPTSNETSRTRVVILETMGMRTGILADSVEDVFDVSASEIKKPVSSLYNQLGDLVAGEFIYQENNVTLLEGEKLLKMILI